MALVAVSIIIESIAALIALLDIDELLSAAGAVHIAIGGIFSIALRAIRVSIALLAALIAVSIAIMLIAALQTVLINAAFEIAIFNALIVVAWLTAFIAVAIIIMRIATAIAFLAYVAGFSAIIAYSICIAILDLIGHATAGAVFKYAAFFTTLIANAVSIMLFTALLAIFIRVRPLLNLAAVLRYIVR